MDDTDEARLIHDSDSTTDLPDYSSPGADQEHALTDTLVSIVTACDPRQATRPRTLAHAIARELLRGTMMLLTTLVVLISPVVAQEVGGGESCSTLLQRLASNGVPFLMRWGVALSMLAAMAGGIMYVVHKKPDAMRSDIEYMKTAGMGAIAVVAAPTMLKLIFGNILGLTLAECIDVGLGIVETSG